MKVPQKLVLNQCQVSTFVSCFHSNPLNKGMKLVWHDLFFLSRLVLSDPASLS